MEAKTGLKYLEVSHKIKEHSDQNLGKPDSWLRFDYGALFLFLGPAGVGEDKYLNAMT